jgi:transposase
MAFAVLVVKTAQWLYAVIFNPLNPELNPIYYLLALLGAHHFLHVSRIRVKSLTLRLLMSYIYIWSAYS